MCGNADVRTHSFYINQYLHYWLTVCYVLVLCEYVHQPCCCSFTSSLCTTRKASRNSLKSMLPSLLKSMLRAMSSMARSSTSTPKWELNRFHVWRNSSMEIWPAKGEVQNLYPTYKKFHLQMWSIILCIQV